MRRGNRMILISERPHDFVLYMQTNTFLMKATLWNATTGNIIVYFKIVGHETMMITKNQQVNQMMMQNSLITEVRIWVCVVLMWATTSKLTYFNHTHTHPSFQAHVDSRHALQIVVHQKILLRLKTQSHFGANNTISQGVYHVGIFARSNRQST